jgi:hypothetical protein
MIENKHARKVSHYDRLGVECGEVIGRLPFWLASAYKYIWRAGFKDGVPEEKDLGKACDCLNRFLQDPEWWSSIEAVLGVYAFDANEEAGFLRPLKTAIRCENIFYKRAALMDLLVLLEDVDAFALDKTVAGLEARIAKLWEERGKTSD